jgi:hypothetical protein
VKVRKERMLSDDWAKISRQLETGKAQPGRLPQELPLPKIKVWPGVFQHRGRREASGERHVRDLAAAIKKTHSKTLDPLTVWWDGKSWACIDGHHRLDAYRVAVGSNHSIPVQVFEGTLEEAMSRAALANTKDKLPMSSAEKSNSAWRLVSATSLSKRQIADSSGVGESTVASMRRILAQLTARATPADDFDVSPSADLRDLSWGDARRLAAGEEAGDFDWEVANEKKAQEWALAIRRALGKEGGKYPEILARALDIYDSRLVSRLVDHWREDEDAEEAEEETADI